MQGPGEINKDLGNSEKPAVKTTIVGGRPPGSGKGIDSIPRGIEVLVKKASVDPAFKDTLLKERAAAANSIGLCLQETEISMLNNIPQPYLEGIISATKVSPNMRQIFLGCVATVMLAALTATAGASEDELRVGTQGIRPADDVDDGAGPAITDFQRTPEGYFNVAQEDSKLETGSFEVQIVDDVARAPIVRLGIRFTKIPSQFSPPTEGLGYTDVLGTYRIDGLPVGKYSIEVAIGSSYVPESQEVEISVNKKSALFFSLQRHYDQGYRTGSMGIRPLDE